MKKAETNQYTEQQKRELSSRKKETVIKNRFTKLNTAFKIKLTYSTRNIIFTQTNTLFKIEFDSNKQCRSKSHANKIRITLHSHN